MKSSFKVKEVKWLDTKKEVKKLSERKLVGYVANNETPPQICIIMTAGPNDLGEQRDVIIDINSLRKEMSRLGV